MKQLETSAEKALEREEKLVEKNLKDIEEELETVGENMKQLETSAEKALEREEKLVEKIYNLQSKYKVTEARFEYGEMNTTKTHYWKMRNLTIDAILRPNL